MTARRVSQETSKYFAAAASPRRSTRASLSRFAYRQHPQATVKDADSQDDNDDNDDNDDSDSGSSGFSPTGSDIEDAVPPGRPAPRRRAPARGKVTAPSTVTEATRKRKRATTVASTTVIKSETLAAETTVTAGSETDQKPASKARRDRKPARARTDPATGVVKMEPPSDWEEMYALVKEMRLAGPAKDAAVDTMGCERLAAPDASPKDRRFHTLIALMLSSQTKDTVNAVAMARLKSELPPYRDGAPAGLNLDNILAVEPALLNSLIYGVGFHNMKTKYIKQAAEILRDKWAGDIPDTIEGLMSLPGVGPKMAHLCMAAPNGWNRVEGVGVDVHVHRITNLWGWNGTAPTKNPEATRAALESWLPRDRWREINWLLVGFGQMVCLPVGRKCGDCELGLRGLCRAADRKKVAEGRKRREEAGLLFKKEEEEEEEVVKVKVDDLGVAAATLKNEEITAVKKEREVAAVKEETVETAVKQEVADELVPIKEEAPESPDARPAKTRRRARG